MKLKLKKLFTLIMLMVYFGLFSTGCNSSGLISKNKDGVNNKINPDQELPAVAVTKWTKKMELFTEYQLPVKGSFVKFIIHLTKLKDFQPIRSGKVYINFNGINGTTSFKIEHNKLLREGIFTPLVQFKSIGAYKTILKYKGEGLQESFDLGTITVVGRVQDLPDPEQEDAVDEISFLKEQQWKTEFNTESVVRMSIKPSSSVVAEVLPRQQDMVEVTAPVVGVLDPGVNKYMAVPGMSVKRGDVIALLAPPAGTGESWQQIQLSLTQAKDRFLRAERLLKKGAISNREYEDLQRKYLLLKTGFPKNVKGKKHFFTVTSPIDGTVKDVSVILGRHVKKGETLLTIVNSSRVWLKMNLFEKDYYKFSKSSGASIHLPGLSAPLHLDADQLELLSKGDILDQNTGTIPLLFETANPSKLFKIGQVLQVNLYTDEKYEALCIPSDAVYDDDGQEVVFVQLGGESFEKRSVKSGIKYLDLIEIKTGLRSNERVVTKGNYFVKLASTSTPIGHGHAH